MPITLVGLLLTCSLGLPGSADEILPAPLLSAAAASDPLLPRNFALPTPLFARHSAWNQIITLAAVLPESSQQILVTYRVLRGDTTDLHPSGEPPPTEWPFMYVNYDDYTIPIFRMGAAEQSVLLCDYEGYPGGTNPKLPVNPDETVNVPAPVGTVRPAGPEDTGADGHLVLYNSETFEEYDFWQATTVRDAPCQSWGGGLTGTAILEAGAIDFFDVRGTGTNPDTYFSARATGVPLLAGLILPEDVESGVISHALAFAIPGLRNLGEDPYEPLSSDYFYPASTTETDYYNTNPHALAAGQRIRLRGTIVDDEGITVDEQNDLTPITRMFLTALRTYGAYLVDNAGGFTFYAEDIHTADLDLTDDQVNTLIGQPPGTPLPADKTKWQLVVEKLNEELEQIPFAYGPWTEGQDPRTAEITTSNFDVVSPATHTSVYLPLILNNFTASPLPGLAEPMSLGDVSYWAYQLQEISEPGAVDALVSSHYDMLVLEPTRTDWSSDDKFFDTQGMVSQLKSSEASDGVHRKLVIAYIDIGEAEDWRWYWTWSQDWDCAGHPPADWPDYILACDPDGWTGNYPVAYWDEDWRDIVIYGDHQGSDPDRDYDSVIDEAIKDGFDGIYLDWVEGFENEAVMAAAQAAGKDPAVEMIAFIQEMKDYATVRHPDFLVIQQNAAALSDGHPELFTLIDAISQEAIWYDGDATDEWNDPNGYDWLNESSLINYYIGYLDGYLDAGVPVFDCEYALVYADTAYANAINRGYVPYVTRRSLARLTTTPPPGY
jgi:cysteinyl-tRNA synthetase